MKALTLYVAGSARNQRFAVMADCDGKPVPVWVGAFGKYEKTFSPRGGLESAECSAVEKGYWVGWKVAEGLGDWVDVVILTSHRFDRQFAGKLVAMGKRKQIKVVLGLRSRLENPAYDQLGVWEFMRPDLARAARCAVNLGTMGTVRKDP